jgi:hypothetical protein
MSDHTTLTFLKTCLFNWVTVVTMSDNSSTLGSLRHSIALKILISGGFFAADVGLCQGLGENEDEGLWDKEVWILILKLYYICID